MKTKELTPKINLILFSLLLIATPFLMLQNYLQHFIRSLSNFSLQIGSWQIPYVLLIAILILITFIIVFRRKITLFRVLALLFVILLMIIGQYTSDYYTDYKFYDLQNNWHYFAYGTFVFVAYRALKSKNMPKEKIIIRIFLMAFFISSFDEGIQVFISNRIFDISDIAKDLWGVIMGLVVLFFVVEQGKIISNGWKVRHRKISDYLKHPFSVLFFLTALSYFFLFFSSILTEDRYWYYIFIISFVIFAIFFFILHLSQFKVPRIILIIILAAAVIIQSFSYFQYKNDSIVYNAPGLIIYKGIPILFFDVMIYPDGLLRLVDKKEFFIGGDIQTFFNQKSDILLIASGKDGQGGKGFSGIKHKEFAYFIYNTVTKRGLQVAVLKTPDACKMFNRLKKEGRNVLFVIHNE